MLCAKLPKSPFGVCQAGLRTDVNKIIKPPAKYATSRSSNI
jgi:hypothetical protein